MIILIPNCPGCGLSCWTSWIDCLEVVWWRSGQSCFVECRGTSKTKCHLNTVWHLSVAVDQRLTLTSNNFFATAIGFCFAEETKFFLPNQVMSCLSLNHNFWISNISYGVLRPWYSCFLHHPTHSGWTTGALKFLIPHSIFWINLRNFLKIPPWVGFVKDPWSCCLLDST